jgi:putative lipoprotein
MRPRAAARCLLCSAALLAGGRAPARAEGRDDWFGHDKALHFEATFAISAVGYAGAAMATDRVSLRLAAGAALGLGAGAGKELWDLSGHGDASWRDFTWDAVGTAAGLAVAATIDWAVRRLTRGCARAAR